MSTWIEEAENRQKEKNTIYSQGTTNNSETINDNLERLLPFINKLTILVERVSHISPEERKPSLEVGSTHLEGDLRFEFYGSAIKLREKKFLLLFNKTVSYVFWRRLYINVTDNINLVKITLYEKAISQINPNDVIKQKIKLLVSIDKCSENICYNIIDWIAFKISTSELKRYIPHLHQ